MVDARNTPGIPSRRGSCRRTGLVPIATPQIGDSRVKHRTKFHGMATTQQEARVKFRLKRDLQDQAQNQEQETDARPVLRLPATRIVGADALPDEIREFSGLERIDFADQVIVAGVPRRTAEEWARATIGIVHPVAATLIWRIGLSGQLDHRRSPDLIGGWRVAHSDEHRIRLDIPSPKMGLRLMLTTQDDRVALTTCVRFDNSRGKAAWKAIEPLHALGDPRLLASAARAEHARDYGDPTSKDHRG